MTVIAPHETDEFRNLTVTDSTGDAVSAYQWQITARGERPTGTWLGPVSHSGGTGFTVAGLAAGQWWLWVKITDTPYAPILEPIPLYLD